MTEVTRLDCILVVDPQGRFDENIHILRIKYCTSLFMVSQTNCFIFFPLKSGNPPQSSLCYTKKILTNSQTNCSISLVFLLRLY